MMAFGTLYDLFVFQSELERLPTDVAVKHKEKSRKLFLINRKIKQKRKVFDRGRTRVVLVINNMLSHCAIAPIARVRARTRHATCAKIVEFERI